LGVLWFLPTNFHQVGPEDFSKAGIDSNILGPNQPDPVSPDEEWPERPAS